MNKKLKTIYIILWIYLAIYAALIVWLGIKIGAL